MYIKATRQQFLWDADGFCYFLIWGKILFLELSYYFCNLERLGYFSLGTWLLLYVLYSPNNVFSCSSFFEYPKCNQFIYFSL